MPVDNRTGRLHIAISLATNHLYCYASPQDIAEPKVVLGHINELWKELLCKAVTYSSDR